MLTWFFILFAASIFTLADFFSANWGKTNDRSSLIFLFLLAPLGYLFFGILNRFTTLSVSAAIVNLLIVVGGVLIGNIYFRDILITRQLIGILLALIAIFLMRS